jgi:hypothetical protein
VTRDNIASRNRPAPKEGKVGPDGFKVGGGLWRAGGGFRELASFVSVEPWTVGASGVDRLS